MIETIPPKTLAVLAERLTDPEDRETYAALISFLDSLPENDELFRLAQLLGLVSLVSQRIPEAMGECLAEFRQQTKAVAEYWRQVDARLASLPGEIAAGVDAGAIAAAMSERFRQQFTASGLQESATVLGAAAKEIKALSGEIARTLRPVPQEYRSIMTAISEQLAQLKAASETLRAHNAELVVRERATARWVDVLVIVFVFLAGGWAGMLLDKQQTTAALADVAAQIERLQAPANRPHSAIPAGPVAPIVGKRGQ